MDNLAIPIISYILLLVFLFSLIDKVRNWHAFVSKVEEYRLLPKKLVKPVNYFFILIELYLVFVFLLMKFSLLNLFIFVLLICMYTGAIAINLYRGNTLISCGCGGPLENDRLSSMLLIRNLSLILLGGSLLFLDPLHYQWADLLNAFLVSLSILLLYGVINLFSLQIKLVKRLKEKLEYFSNVKEEF
ncbi:MauE/DoxX family redox-associated membrane protein [Bacillus spongiae]|uniref:MauE/DoxX family redox-associated membrane protein n=1 Tax=Bacillus spongiae TaxID=2683610 RepID=A0ABU8HEP6_9BACI